MSMIPIPAIPAIRILLILMSLVTVLSSQLVLAVDKSRLWLPKTFQQAEAKLMAAAQDAEASHRCVDVVSGQMVISKNTEDDYFFLITCRDRAVKTYSLSFLYPKVGDILQRVVEQGVNNNLGEDLEAKENGVNPEQALELCQEDVGAVTSQYNDVTMLDDEISDVIEKDNGFFYQLPFATTSDLGSDIQYAVQCQVSKEGIIQLDIALASIGALALCRDSLRSEAALLGRIKIDDDKITKLATSTSTHFYFVLPFELKSRSGSILPYGSSCKVKTIPELDVSIHIEPNQSAMSEGCIKYLKMKTQKMKDVVILKEGLQKLPTEDGGGFKGLIFFNAKDPSGRELQYQAKCIIDVEGSKSVKISGRESSK